MKQEQIDRLSAVLARRSVRAVARDGELTKQLWDLAFGEAVPEQARQQVGYDGCRWHLFSSGLLEAKAGEEARQAVSEKQSQRLQLFWQPEETAWELRNAFDLDAAAVDAMAEAVDADLFVFDDEGGWTYVLTRAEGFGPYFFQW